MNIVKISLILASITAFTNAWAIPFGTNSPLGCFNMSLLMSTNNAERSEQEQQQEETVDQVLLPTGLKICTSVRDVAEIKGQDYFVRQTGNFNVRISDNNNTLMASYDFAHSTHDDGGGIAFTFFTTTPLEGETAMNFEDNFPNLDDQPDMMTFQMYDDQMTCDAEYGMVAFQGNSYYLFPVVNECE